VGKEIELREETRFGEEDGLRLRLRRKLGRGLTVYDVCEGARCPFLKSASCLGFAQVMGKAATCPKEK
jgi:hypothetical protein